MWAGVPREIEPQAFRVRLSREAVGEFIVRGHEVVIA